MNDFLSALVARARGEDIVRPRLPSRFEPARGTASPGDDRTESETPPAFAPATAPVPASFGSLVDTLRSSTRGTPPPGAIEEAPARTVFASRAAAVNAGAPPRAAAALVAPSRDTRPPLPAPPIDRDNLPTPHPVGDRSNVPVPATPWAPAMRAAAAPQEAPSPARTTPAAALTPPAPLAVAKAEAPALAPTARPRPAPSWPPPPQRRASSGDTTVHVSIGRVEVHLEAQAPARARVAPAPSPVMSLDDYLRSRAGR
jgi:hypothetical protein